MKPLKELFFINFFILCLLVSTISNYSLWSFVLKSSIAIILIIFVITLEDMNKIQPIFFQKIILFISLPLLSLLWSKDINFALLKMLNIMVSVLPLIWVSESLYRNLTELSIKIFVNTIFILVLSISLITLLFHPFEYNTPYIFEITRWSHVIVGRFLSASIIIILLLKRYVHNLNRKMFIASMIIIYCGLYFTGFRAGLIFSLLISFLILLKNQTSLRKVPIGILYVVGLILLIIAADYFYFDTTLLERYLKLFSYHPRIEALEISWKLFKENPFWGVGFGGFANTNSFTNLMKYPHNLIAEVLVEFGLIGVFWLIALLSFIFLNNKSETRYYLLLAFLLSMTSKDISTNTMLWIGLAINNNQSFSSVKKTIYLNSKKYLLRARSSMDRAFDFGSKG